MAEIEEAAGDEGAVREWLNRAARAPRDRAWVADGVISDHWAPVSPSGVLDAFVWRTPDERLSAPYTIEPVAVPAAEAVAPAPAVIEPPPPPSVLPGPAGDVSQPPQAAPGSEASGPRRGPMAAS